MGPTRAPCRHRKNDGRAAGAAAAFLLMRIKFHCFLLGVLTVTGVLGCNWGLIFAFRAQMRAVGEFTAWAGPNRDVFVFKKPLIRLSDLGDFEIFPEVLDSRTAVLRYRRIDPPAGTQADLEIRLIFENDKLAGVVFPAPLRDGLGRGNIVGFFAMMGGEGFPEGVGAIPKEQVVAANLFPHSAEPLGEEVQVLLMPLDRQNRPIHVTLKERPKKPGYFGEVNISFKKRPGAGK